MAALNSLQITRPDHRVERERERMLRYERKQERVFQKEQQAQAKGVSVKILDARTREKIAFYKQRLTEIDKASDAFYVILIMAALFKAVLSIITIIPIIGLVLSMVVSMLLMILNVILLFAANSVEPVKVHNRFYVRLLILLMMYMLDTLLPFLTFFVPIALMSSVVIYLLVKRDRRIEKKRIEKKLLKLSSTLAV